MAGVLTRRAIDGDTNTEGRWPWGQGENWINGAGSEGTLRN